MEKYILEFDYECNISLFDGQGRFEMEKSMFTSDLDSFIVSEIERIRKIKEKAGNLVCTIVALKSESLEKITLGRIIIESHKSDVMMFLTWPDAFEKRFNNVEIKEDVRFGKRNLKNFLFSLCEFYKKQTQAVA